MKAAVVVALLAMASATEQREMASANPIRKVVTMLQMMQKKVAAEGEKEKELFEKFMCWCQTGGGDLGKSIAAAEAKAPELEASIKEAISKKAQLEGDLDAHKKDRAAAKQAIADATALREKENAAFEQTKADLGSNLDALAKATAAIEKGMAGFLQTSAAAVLKRLVMNKNDMEENDRSEVLAFLSGGQGYSPASGEIVGILKTMHDEMSASLADATKAEAAAVAAFNALVAAKKKEIAALTKNIEKKLQRVGELGLSIAQMKNELGDTAEGLAEDKKFLADLEKNCADKKAEWAVRTKTRGEELLALSDTIKVLNDDDALELFKKTLPSGASLVQLQTTEENIRARALSLLQSSRSHRPSLDFIALALRGKKIGFEKVIKMIDNLVAELKQEQKDDDDKKAYCAKAFDEADDKKKQLERAISDLEAAIEDAKEGIATFTAEIKALTDSIKALDKSVVEATEQRKQENDDFKALMANDAAAKEVMNFAINRLNKFYNPKLYKPPAKRQLTEEEQVTLNMGGTLAPTEAPGGIAGTGISAIQGKVAPPPPPETFGAYSKKSEESGGVIQMIKTLIKDLDKEMTEAEAEEKNAQADYEKFTSDSAAKRAEDTKALTDKQAAKAEAEGALQTHGDDLKVTQKEHGATLQTIANLHGECDWLIQFYAVRQEARGNEIDALGKAKAVLSGADYSLIQTHESRAFLSRN